MTIPSVTDDLIKEIEGGQIVPALTALSEIYCAHGLERKSVLLAAAARIEELEKDAARYRKALTEITEIEFELFGADWEEIEEAQNIAETALQAPQ